ncbi:MAG: hypothetical protein HWE30_02795 [Methylocystaceae bacterium]|nr:hypothetical protein [Methylocystaceae bacterium]
MKMSVTPREIAEHLVEELGHQKALETCRHHLGRCYSPETAGIWSNIGQVLETYPLPEHRH